jgi:gluconate kinase
MAKEKGKSDMAQDKAMVKKAVGKHEKRLHPGKSLTKLKAGGPTTDDRARDGRNMSRAKNQGA